MGVLGRIGAFELVELLGRGGMGVVYRARDPDLHRQVALKVISEDNAAEGSARERFRREALAAASVEHPHIVPVYGAGEADGILWIVMRLIDGPDPRSLVRTQGPLSPTRATRLLASIARALGAAHARGLIHRDVKPGNVLIANVAGEEHAYLTDFGLAHLSSDEHSLTEPGRWVGTLDYAAPEQLRGGPLDSRTDVYALGCVLHFALAGESPYPGADLASKMQAKLHGIAPKALSDPLGRVVMRALAYNQEDRFASSESFADAMLAAIEESTLSASGPVSPSPPRVAPVRGLPTPANELIGRERDVQAVAEMIEHGRRRLLTVVGAGGVGKTRVAVEVASRLADDFADGCWLVSLAPVAVQAELSPAIAVALGAPRRGDEPATVALQRFLAEKRALLVLDNFEHLLDAAPVAAELLATCPRLFVLATSREPLGLSAEQLYRLDPLAAPPRDGRSGVTEPERFPAVALFCERARARDARFELDKASAADVGELCRRLDGLPLAIELAAARTDLLSPADLVGRLDDALQLLTRGRRDAPERQRTLQATIDWSYQLLSPPERRAFARIAMFRAGVEVSVAEDVTNASLDDLDALVAKHLLVRQDGRLTMLETVRAYALERLAEDSEAPEAWRRLATWCVELFAEGGAYLPTSERATWRPRLEREFPNAAAALSWSIDQRDGTVALELVGALERYWYCTERVHEGRRWIDAVLTEADDAPAALRAQALLARARFAGPREFSTASVDAEASLRLYRAIDDATGIAESLAYLTSVYLWHSDQKRAARFANEALQEAQRSGDQVALAHAAGAMEFTAETHERMVAHGARAIDLLLGAGWVDQAANACSDLGYAETAAGNYSDAQSWFSKGLTLISERDFPRAAFLLHSNRGLAWLLAGHPERGDADFRRALALCSGAACEAIIDETLLGLAVAAAQLGHPVEAAQLAGAADAHQVTARIVNEDTLWKRLIESLAPARTALGERAWQRAYRAGAALETIDAIAASLPQTSAAVR